VADSLYNRGELEKARAEYMNAMRFKPNQAEIILKLNEINQKLGITGTISKTDSSGVKAAPANVIAEKPAVIKTDQYQFGPFSGAVTGVNEYITLENNKIELKIALKGGRVYSARLKEYRTSDSLPLILFNGDSTVFGFNFFTVDNKAIQTNNLYFIPLSGERNYIIKSEAQSVKLRLNADSGKYIEYTYTLAPDKYMVDFNVKFNSMEDVIAPNQSNITLDWKMYIPQQEKGRKNEELYTTIKFKFFQDVVDGLKLRSTKDETRDIPTKLSWVAFQDQFFSSVILSNDFFQNGFVSSTVLPEFLQNGAVTTSSPVLNKYIRYYTTELGVPFNLSSSNVIGMKMYFGPNQFNLLKKEGQQLERLVFLGKNIIGWINRFAIIPIFNWLEKYIGSYGLIILILTIIIKVVLFPLTFKSYQSQAKMQVLKPMVEELGKKFPKKEDSMKKQQATMELYKRILWEAAFQCFFRCLSYLQCSGFSRYQLNCGRNISYGLPTFPHTTRS
jgi:YidC/Oxa1 family membrane protein insertase